MTPGLSLSLNSNLVYLNLEKEKEKGELMDSDSFLLRWDDIFICTIHLHASFARFICTLASERHSACQRALQRLPANVNSVCRHMSEHDTVSSLSFCYSYLKWIHLFMIALVLFLSLQASVSSSFIDRSPYLTLIQHGKDPNTMSAKPAGVIANRTPRPLDF